jgi:hypothetical protein
MNAIFSQRRHERISFESFSIIPFLWDRTVMTPHARQKTTEENVFDGIASGWAYFMYAIRQIIIFLPCLWAGYERGRRKEEKIRKMQEKGGGLRRSRRRDETLFIIDSVRAKRKEHNQRFWSETDLREEDLECLAETVLSHP